MESIADRSDVAPRYVDSEWVARTLGLPLSWVQRQAAAGHIPSRKFGHYRRFDVDEVLSWAKRRDP